MKKVISKIRCFNLDSGQKEIKKNRLCEILVLNNIGCPPAAFFFFFFFITNKCCQLVWTFLNTWENSSFSELYSEVVYTVSWIRLSESCMLPQDAGSQGIELFFLNPSQRCFIRRAIHFGVSLCWCTTW